MEAFIMSPLAYALLLGLLLAGIWLGGLAFVMAKNNRRAITVLVKHMHNPNTQHQVMMVIDSKYRRSMA